MRTINVIEGIFFIALEKCDASERAAYLDQACQGDAELRRAVERMLAVHPRVGDFLQAPAGGQGVTTEHVPLSEKPGTLIGPYKLLQQIGEGGFGVVFLAEQTEPVRRKVALKVIKPGMDSKQVLARFEQERQALALMDHPNIARVFDGGTTDSGRPYFVMELVKGTPITAFCDDHRLSPRERLALFVPVCQAIQHAHHKGIIHRDIKPSNVLVALYDDKPVVKVIDFGVAKAVEQPLTDRTLFTRVGQVIGTFEYMSPEQASLNALDVDTRSDVYALGVLLYELLTGGTPLPRARLAEAGFAEMLRLVREEEAPAPSVRLSDSGEALAGLANARKTAKELLPGLLRGELDWIALKALEKDRSRRYGTATDMAADIGRYLRDEPVEACPPSYRYRASKFARKHRAAITLLGTAAILLILGTLVSGWQAWRAIQAERDALEQRVIADSEKERAQHETATAVAAQKELRQSQYGLTMSLIQSAANAGNYPRVEELLRQQVPGRREEDLRGIEWHYWDRLLNRQLRTVPLRGGAGLTLSGDGQRVAYWLESGAGHNPVLEVAESATGRVLFSQQVEGNERLYGQGLSLDYEGRRVALRLDNESQKERTVVLVFDVGSRKQLFARTAPRFRQLALDWSGRRLATIEQLTAFQTYRRDAVGDFAVKLWDIDASTVEPVLNRAVKAANVRWPVISKDGSRLAVRSLQNAPKAVTSTIHVWDTAGKGHIQAQVPVSIECIAIHPNGKQIVGVGVPRSEAASLPFGSELGPAQTYVWDCPGDTIESPRVKFLTGPGQGRSLADFQLVYSPNGQRLAVWNGGIWGVRILDTAGAEETHVIQTPLATLDAVLNPDGTRLFTAGGRSQSLFAVREARWREWDVKPSVPREVDAPSDWVVRSRDGEREAVYRRTPREARAPATIQVRDRTGKEIHVFRGHADASIAALSFNADGRLIRSRSSNECLIWETDSGTIVFRHRATPGFRRTGGFTAPVSPDRQLLLMPGSRGAVVRFESGLPEIFSVGLFHSAQFSPDSKRLVTRHRDTTEDGKLAEPPRGFPLPSRNRLWDVAAGKLIGTLPQGFPVFGPGGQLAVVNDDGLLLHLLDAATGQEQMVMKGQFGPGCVFSRDGARLLSGLGGFGSQPTPIVWNALTGKELFRLEGHAGRQVVGAFSRDGKRIATVGMLGNGQREIKVWDSGGRELLSEIEKEGGLEKLFTGRVVFSDDGHQLILRSAQGGVGNRILLDATPRPEGK